MHGHHQLSGYKKILFDKFMNRKGILFHLIGLCCFFWFLIRVAPAPHRSQYPCQQISIPIVLAYLAFWGGLFVGLTHWIRKVKIKAAVVAPAFIVISLISCALGGMVFAGSLNNNNPVSLESWNPIPNQPMGTPQGLNPGRVVWVWNPDATPNELNGFWWEKQNNNEAVIDTMISTGIRGLMGADNESAAWDLLFKSFNQIHGYGTGGYQPGEKIAIKVNLNNAWEYLKNPYTERDNERDEDPYVVKALLRSLVNVVGVPQEDITIFDASRQMPNWFYYRVYYETYPTYPLTPEFPNVHYVDTEGGAAGREQVIASDKKIFFADGSGFTRTLPTCVVDAKYLINMPILKRHPINQGVTLSGKNLFGVFIEPVVDVHPYHEAGFTLGHSAPQMDLLADEQLGGKTLLYLGDGLFGTKVDHRTIAKFQMYPFNDDWSNSLFFSQDPVAIDSVMYDFLKAEGTNPCEGSQNYLHQAAEPPVGVYDPENDDVFVTASLGVHEHWNTSVDIFSSERYSGEAGNGIDFVALGGEDAVPAIVIVNPQQNHLYIRGQLRNASIPLTVIIGNISVEAQVNGVSSDVEKVEFSVDGQVEFTDTEAPYVWMWDERGFFRHTIKTTAFYDTTSISDTLVVWKVF
ncbi:MAG: DUF362 domain-containing protein [Methanobacteriota archaeon]